MCTPLVCAAAGSLDPCALLTHEEVGRILGGTVNKSGRDAPTQCNWVASAPGAKGTNHVVLTLKTAHQFELNIKPIGGGYTKEPVGGLGDEAVVGTTPKYGREQHRELYVRKGETRFSILVTGSAEESAAGLGGVLEMEKSLALHVLQKL
jgi:hypothetical protein